jgi:glutathione S-transferase
MHILYAHPQCPYAQRTLLALEILNTPKDIVRVEMIDFAVPPNAMLTVNPDWTVPMLVNANSGRGIDDSLQILEFLDALAPQNSTLFPSSPEEFFLTKFRNQLLCKNLLGPAREVIYSFGNKLGETDRFQRLNQAYDYFEQELAKTEGTFLGGENLNGSDLVIVTFVVRLLASRVHNRNIPMPKQGTRARRYFEAAANHPVIQKICGEIPAIAQQVRAFCTPPDVVQNLISAPATVVDKQVAAQRTGWKTMTVSETTVLAKSLQFDTAQEAKRALNCLVSLQETAEYAAFLELDGNKSINVMAWTPQPHPHLTERDVAFAQAIDGLAVSDFEFGNSFVSSFM